MKNGIAQIFEESCGMAPGLIYIVQGQCNCGKSVFLTKEMTDEEINKRIKKITEMTDEERSEALNKIMGDAKYTKVK